MAIEPNGTVYNSTPLTYGMVVAPSSATTTENVFSMYSSQVAHPVPAKTDAMKSESSLTYAAVPLPRKRSRETMISPMIPSFSGVIQNHSAANRCGPYSFLGEDISLHIQQQQLEIDRFIAQHTEKVRMEIEERRKRDTRRIAAAVEENIIKKLRAKEEEIEKIGKLNWALEERVKSLSVENQIWRDLAQSNEATANALRSNLEQVLAQVQDDQQQQQQQQQYQLDNEAAALADDAQSCCDSNFQVRDYHRNNLNFDNNECTTSRQGYSDSALKGNRMCRSCGKEEPCVLLLPCRHLCLCTVCGSSLHTCPVCNSTKTASVHVNLSS